MRPSIPLVPSPAAPCAQATVTESRAQQAFAAIQRLEELDDILHAPLTVELDADAMQIDEPL